LIAAVASNGGLGLEGKMPWHLPGELRHFREVTMGKPIVMGRKTWESIGKPLPGRQNIVISRNPAFQAPGCEVYGSLEQAIANALGNEVMVIGGGEIYRRALPLATRMVLTLVDCAPTADTWFPDWKRAEWTLVRERTAGADAGNQYGYRVQEWLRS